MLDIATRVGAEATVILATPIFSRAAASGMPARPVTLTGAPTALTSAAMTDVSRSPNG